MVDVAPGTSELSQAEADVAPDDRIRCAACRSVVTEGGLAAHRGGAHQHTFRNPAGYSWTVRCFRDAAGCGSEGTLTGEATWFAGYEWCYAVCKACSRHLGWWFVGTGPPFVALISSRITAG